MLKVAWHRLACPLDLLLCSYVCPFLLAVTSSDFTAQEDEHQKISQTSHSNEKGA